MHPIVLDFDGSVGTLPQEMRVDLRDWQEALRFACRIHALRALAHRLDGALALPFGTVFTGSGDFHHVTLCLLARCAAQAPVDVIVFDNHPDNMRFIGGVHCGSWVRHAARLPFVRHVQVVGIGASDVSGPHAWANYLGPLRRGKVSYWCIGVDTSWARRLGLAHAVLGFDSAAAMLDRFADRQRRARAPVYLSIDKDVLDVDEARTNWDQGSLRTSHLLDAIACLRGRIVGSDITGEVSLYRYASRWKRLLSALDRQPRVDPEQLPAWQARQHAMNLELLPAIAAAHARDAQPSQSPAAG